MWLCVGGRDAARRTGISPACRGLSERMLEYLYNVNWIYLYAWLYVGDRGAARRTGTSPACRGLSDRMLKYLYT